jgi:hypothetical protein
MADIRDFQDAQRETGEALAGIRELALPIADALADDELASEDRRVALAVLTVGEALVLALRELGTRIDYVIRDEARR